MKTRESIIAEIKAEVIKSGYKITDLFTPEQIRASKPMKEAMQIEYEHLRRVQKEYDKAKKKRIKLEKKVLDKN
jgi:hypothetical protein